MSLPRRSLLLATAVAVLNASMAFAVGPFQFLFSRGPSATSQPQTQKSSAKGYDGNRSATGPTVTGQGFNGGRSATGPTVSKQGFDGGRPATGPTVAGKAFGGGNRSATGPTVSGKSYSPTKTHFWQ